MRILLINPPSFYPIESCLPEPIERGRGYIPPLSLMCIASYLQKYTKNEIRILDAQVEKLNYNQLEKEVRKREPDIVGITAMSFTLIDVIKTLQLIKKIDKNITTILGGPHPTIYPEETARIKEVDFCIIGEGEKVALELVKNINNLKKLKQIKGIAFQLKNKIINTGQANFIENLDELPFPARDLVSYDKYYSSISTNFPVTAMFTSRGCPYNCLFCDRPALGKRFRTRSAKNIVDEMEECEKMGIKEIFIYDDTFGVDKQRVLDICTEKIKRGLKIFWDVRTRVNTVDKEILKKMKEAGCQRIHYGVESGTQKILNILRKGITLEQVERAFRITREAGIEAEGYFMIGSPTENKCDIEKTIKFMKKIKPNYVHITITMPFPATDLYKLALKENVIKEDVWKKFAENPKSDFKPPFWEKELSRKELFKLLKGAYRSFYLRPNYILNKIFQLRSFKDLLNKTRAAFKLLKI